MTDLQPGISYFFRIAAFSSVGKSEYVYANKSTVPAGIFYTFLPPYSFYHPLPLSAIHIANSFVGAPSTPANLSRKEYTRNLINVTWSIPVDDGGYPVLFYTLRMLNLSSWIEINVTGKQYLLSSSFIPSLCLNRVVKFQFFLVVVS